MNTDIETLRAKAVESLAHYLFMLKKGWIEKEEWYGAYRAVRDLLCDTPEEQNRFIDDVKAKAETIK